MREVLRKIDITVSAVALVLLGAMVTVCARTATAQDMLVHEYDRIKNPRQIMNAEVQRGIAQVGRYGTESAIGQKFALPPLPGDQSFADSISDPKNLVPQEEAGVPDFGANEKLNTNIVFPPLKGLAQILNSSVTKEYLKQLTAAETTVLMQTYFMVENGAATGFMGGMNIGSNLMQNLLQSQDFQLKLLEASDTSGKLKEAYVNRISAVMKTGDTKDVWPAALYIASGDDGKATDAPVMKDLSLATKEGAFNLKELKAYGSSANSSDSKKLSDILFADPTGQTADTKRYTYDQTQIAAMRLDFVNLVGDIEITLKPDGANGSTPSSGAKYVRDLKINYVAPPSKDTKDKRRGVARVNWEEVQLVWKGINTLLYDYCRWKEKNPNAGRQPFELETSTTTKDIGGGAFEANGYTPWDLSSAPDITMTMNVLDQIFKIYEENRPPGQLACEKLPLDEDDIPEDAGPTESSGSGGGKGVNLNDCGPKKGCLKNRVVLHLSYMIARSRTLHTYRAMYNISRRFVTDEFTGELVDKLFMRAFSGMDVNSELEANRARYDDFVNYMGKLTQGALGAGPNIRPGQSEKAELSPK